MKRVWLLALPLILVSAASALAQGWCYSDFAAGNIILNGTHVAQPLSGATVTVCTSAGTGIPCTPKASIFSDVALTVPEADPITADSNGNFTFCAAQGTYVITIQAGGFTPYSYKIALPPSGTGSCLAGAPATQYVDSQSGNDANAGTNWCSAKATEAAAVTALGATGGWVYVAPLYTGAAATGVPAKVHILETNQADANGSSVHRFSFPSYTQVAENTWSHFVGSPATIADGNTVFAQGNNFGSSNGITALTGMENYPLSTNGAEGTGVLGGIVVNGNAFQANGMKGICVDKFGVDCTGLTAVAVQLAPGGGSMEAGWFETNLVSAPAKATGVVLRAQGGNMPAFDANLLNAGQSAGLDFRTPVVVQRDDWPVGIEMEDSTVQAAGVPIFIGRQNGAVGPTTTNRGVWFGYGTGVVSPTASLQVDASGNFLFENSAGLGTAVTLPNTANSTVALSGARGISAGSITMAAGTGSHTFSTTYSVAPICTATDTTAANAVKVASTTTTVTVTGTGTDVVDWICYPAVN